MLKKIGIFFWSAWATLASYILVFPFMLLMMLVGIFFILFRVGPVVAFMIRMWANCVFWLMFKRLHVRGRTHIHPGRNYLIICNHSSLYDIPAMMTLFPEAKLVAKDKLFQIPLMGMIMRGLGMVSIQREHLKKSLFAIQKASAKATQDNTICIFPEGTRTLDGRLQRFKRGFIHILRHSGLDLLPVTMNGFFTLKPKNRIYRLPYKKLEMVVHQSIPNAELLKMGDDEIIDMAMATIEKGLIL